MTTGKGLGKHRVIVPLWESVPKGVPNIGRSKGGESQKHEAETKKGPCRGGPWGGQTFLLLGKLGREKAQKSSRRLKATQGKKSRIKA